MAAKRTIYLRFSFSWLKVTNVCPLLTPATLRKEKNATLIGLKNTEELGQRAKLPLLSAASLIIIIIIIIIIIVIINIFNYYAHNKK